MWKSVYKWLHTGALESDRSGFEFWVVHLLYPCELGERPLPLWASVSQLSSGVNTSIDRMGSLWDEWRWCSQRVWPRAVPGPPRLCLTLLFSRSVLEIMFCSAALFFSSSLSFLISLSMSWICWKSFNNRRSASLMGWIFWISVAHFIGFIKAET